MIIHNTIKLSNILCKRLKYTKIITIMMVISFMLINIVDIIYFFSFKIENINVFINGLLKVIYFFKGYRIVIGIIINGISSLIYNTNWKKEEIYLYSIGFPKGKILIILNMIFIFNTIRATFWYLFFSFIINMLIKNTEFFMVVICTSIISIIIESKINYFFTS